MFTVLLQQTCHPETGLSTTLFHSCSEGYQHTSVCAFMVFVLDYQSQRNVSKVKKDSSVRGETHERASEKCRVRETERARG